ncbi:hypothetical protein [Gordonia humi]|uniref:Uncharacterized protein n=1 Tax=Gordonia humi TaxID=686429 RepID=A0A840F338_9ACTN|nr:hypothetical protein [Gordonia humi]MBB4136346.1 hypothetical protein [Gordonia humi]
MATYLAIKPDSEFIDTKDFDNARDAYDWHSSIEVPSHELDYQMKVDQDGRWVMSARTDSSEPGVPR